MRLIDADELKTAFPCGESIRTECVRATIDHMPTIEPEQHWIPCGERLPEEKDAGILKNLGIEKRSEFVFATVEVKGKRMTVTACTYDGEWDWYMKCAFPDFKVVAWMDLPSPYQSWGGEKMNDNLDLFF